MKVFSVVLLVLCGFMAQLHAASYEEEAMALLQSLIMQGDNDEVQLQDNVEIEDVFAQTYGKVITDQEFDTASEMGDSHPLGLMRYFGCDNRNFRTLANEAKRFRDLLGMPIHVKLTCRGSCTNVLVLSKSETLIDVDFCLQGGRTCAIIHYKPGRCRTNSGKFSLPMRLQIGGKMTLSGLSIFKNNKCLDVLSGFRRQCKK